MEIRECELPGIGRKFEIVTKSNEKIVVVIHEDGRRELYHFDAEHEECVSSVTLNDTEARQIASIIGGMVYKPQAVESIEMAIEGLIIEWFKVEPEAKAIGQSIGELDIRNKYNVTVISMLRKNMKKLFNPGPDTVIDEGDML
ncbi:cation:proton antiporter regulatory subunit, partial [Bacillaceae bacterium Marseille-Q3522]|nr:cation:proton antiporter regulatory subunit [Bacillaceae bacterium Marseille-Q3522]